MADEGESLLARLSRVGGPAPGAYWPGVPDMGLSDLGLPDLGLSVPDLGLGGVWEWKDDCMARLVRRAMQWVIPAPPPYGPRGLGAAERSFPVGKEGALHLGSPRGLTVPPAGLRPDAPGPGLVEALFQCASGAAAALAAAQRPPVQVCADLKAILTEHGLLEGEPTLPPDMLLQIEKRERALWQTPVEATTAGQAAQLMQLACACYSRGEYAGCRALVGPVAMTGHSAEAWLLLGSACYQLGEYLDCVALMKYALAANPGIAEATSNMANALQQLGQVDAAIHMYMKAIEANPQFTDAYNNLAMCLTSKGAPKLALQCYKMVLQVRVDLHVVHHNMAQFWLSQGPAGNELAQQTFALSLHYSPSYAPAWQGLGQALLEMCTSPEQHASLGKEISDCFSRALALDPRMISAYLGMATNHEMLGRFPEAQSLLREAARLDPKNTDALARLANSLIKCGQLDEAVEVSQRATLLDPLHVEARNNMGNALRGLGQVSEAQECYQRCIDLHLTSMDGAGRGSIPYCKDRAFQLPVLYNNLGGTLKLQGKLMEAAACYQKVVQLHPDIPAAHTNLGACQKDLGLHEEAIVAFKKALSIKPDYEEAICSLFHSQQSICCWDNREAHLAVMVSIIMDSISRGCLPCVQPFHVIAYPLPSDLVLKISRAYASHALTTATIRRTLGPLPPAAPCPRILLPRGRLRIGYVSSDFGNHPLSHLMKSVWALHDRSRFEIFLYALTPSDSSNYRAQAEADADHFLDCSALSDEETARAIHADGVHIALNLNGYTKGARNEIFVLRPAPIQAAYMGFPGTMGADYIPYLISDRVVAPPKTHHCYSEALALMPNSYFVNDYKQSGPRTALMGWPDNPCVSGRGAESAPTRASLGLPEDAFVFYCCNQLYKLDPETFKMWCNILRCVPTGVLWLLGFPPAGEAHLRKEAASQGITGSRVVFSEVTPKEQHLQRSALADLALDTPQCNGHTSACDVLWAGVPIITLPLERMASRVAASLCVALECPEMVVEDRAAYEALAIELGNNPAQVRALRAKIISKRLTCPLFDTARWVGDVEKIYDRMWENYAAGGQPTACEVCDPRQRWGGGGWTFCFLTVQARRRHA